MLEIPDGETDYVLLGRSSYEELSRDMRLLLAVSSPKNLQLVLEAAMDEPPNLNMIGIISSICMRTISVADNSTAREHERLAGIANQFLDLRQT